MNDRPRSGRNSARAHTRGCELGALPKTKFDMLVVPSPENEDVEAVWTALWAYYSWAYYCQLLLRRARRLWRLHMSEEWSTVRLANMLAVADPNFDPTSSSTWL